MRAFTLGIVLSMAVLFPKVSNAQAYASGTPAPEATAATADWQTAGEPIVVTGLVYFATRQFRIFDPQVMQQTGIYQRMPIYSDVTMEPYSVVYVPITRSNMRLYERKREGALAGTTGSLGIPSSTTFDYEFAWLQHQLGCRAATRVVVPEAIPPERLEEEEREDEEAGGGEETGTAEEGRQEVEEVLRVQRQVAVPEYLRPLLREPHAEAVGAPCAGAVVGAGAGVVAHATATANDASTAMARTATGPAGRTA